MLSERPTHPREPPGRQPTGEIEQDAASKEPTPERANVKTIPKRGLAEMRQRMTNACITRVKRWGPLRSPQPLQGTRCNASLSCSVFPSCLPAPCRWPASPTMMGNHHGGGAAYALEAAAQSVTSALQCLQATRRRAGQAPLRLRAGRRAGAYGGGKASRVAGEGAPCSSVRLHYAYLLRVPPMSTAVAAWRNQPQLVSSAGSGARHRVRSSQRAHRA